MSRITCRAVQIMVDMMRDLMERVMDEAATCADSNKSVIIKRKNINAGVRLDFHNGIVGCRTVVLLLRCPCSHFHPSAIPSTLTICCGSRSKQRKLQVVPLRVEPSPLPLLIGPGQHRYGFEPFRNASYLITWNT